MSRSPRPRIDFFAEDRIGAFSHRAKFDEDEKARFGYNALLNCPIMSGSRHNPHENLKKTRNGKLLKLNTNVRGDERKISCYKAQASSDRSELFQGLGRSPQIQKKSV